MTCSPGVDGILVVIVLLWDKLTLTDTLFGELAASKNLIGPALYELFTGKAGKEKQGEGLTARLKKSAGVRILAQVVWLYGLCLAYFGDSQSLCICLNDVLRLGVAARFCIHDWLDLCTDQQVY